MLSTRRQLEIMVLIAISCQLVGLKIGWTWYLLAVYFAALVGFGVIAGLSSRDRKRDQMARARARRSPRDLIRQENGLVQLWRRRWRTMIRFDHREPSTER